MKNPECTRPSDRIRFLYYARLRAAVVFFLIFSFPTLLSAQVELRDPGFPAHETLTYRQTTGDGTGLVKIHMNFLGDVERPHYEYRMSSDSQDLLLRLDPISLCVFYTEVWEKQKDSTIHRSTEIVRNEKKAEPDQLVVTGFYGFDVSLRGFPWQSRDEAKISFLSGPDAFNFELKVKETETLKLNGRSYECRKVQIGLNGILGAIFPKSHYWYSVDPPYYLVRSETSGMQGRDDTVLELVSYSGDL